MRPSEFAQDQSLDLPVFQHALQWLHENENYSPDLVIQLRPTSPIRPRTLVDEAVQMMLDHPEADSVRGVVPSGQNPHKMWKIDPKTGTMKNLLDVPGIAEPYNAPRQILPPVYWQTGHIDVIRPPVILEKNTMSGTTILPVLVDPRFTLDIDNLSDWMRGEYLVYHSGLDMVQPKQHRRPLPEKISLLVFDFDGVMTDNRVWVDENGHEFVAANRSDSLGLKALAARGIKSMVISTETNKVVSARCKKMDISVMQGIEEKGVVLKKFLLENHINPQEVVFMGNDINDLPCFEEVGCGVVVADAQVQALQAADIVLTRNGGFGAVRELCDILFQRLDTLGK
jgi:N-acylneuraminate cytidylyltransferase